MAESMMGEEEACLNEKQKKEIQVKRCDSLAALRSSRSLVVCQSLIRLCNKVLD